MITLIPQQAYRIVKIYPESGFYERRLVLENCLMCVEAHGKQFRYPDFKLEPRSLHHAIVRIGSGFWRGQKILLTYFTVEETKTTLCTCKAYQFPHKPGEGKCPT